MMTSDTHTKPLLHRRDAEPIESSRRYSSLGSASFGIRKKTRLNFYKRNPEVEQSGAAWVSNKSTAVVFKDRKWSLDFFGSFWVKPKMNSQDEKENN